MLASMSAEGFVGSKSIRRSTGNLRSFGLKLGQPRASYPELTNSTCG